MEFDYGITALGQKFHMDWGREGSNPPELVRRWAALVSGDDEGLSELRLLRADLRLLRDSPLSDEEIRLLWRTVAPYYPVDKGSSVGRAWLAEVDRELAPFLPDSTAEEPVSGAREERVRPAVIQLAEEMEPGPERESAWEPEPAGAVVTAITHCARTASPALAFRFLIHAYEEYDAPVPEAARSLFEEVNRTLGYGEFVLIPLEDRKRN